MHETKSDIPGRLSAGDTWRWRRRVAGHSSQDGWELETVVRPVLSDETLALGSEPESDGGWLVVATPAQTGALEPGRYRYTERLKKDEEVFTIRTGTVVVDAASSPSKAARMVALIEDAIEKLVSGQNKQMNVNGRSVSRNELGELRTELGYWKAKLEQEENPGRLGPQVAARFQQPGFGGGPGGLFR